MSLTVRKPVNNESYGPLHIGVVSVWTCVRVCVWLFVCVCLQECVYATMWIFVCLFADLCQCIFVCIHVVCVGVCARVCRCVSLRVFVCVPTFVCA